MDANILTKLDPGVAIMAIGYGHKRVFGAIPERPLWRVVSAWSAFETDMWRAMHDNNFVNLRGSWRGHATSFKASEIIDGVEVFMPPSSENLFRAYPTPVDGAEDAIRFIGTASAPPRPNRYQAAWEAARSGDIPGFVDGLRNPHIPGIGKVPGFFTANPRVYLAGVERYADKLDPYIPGGGNEPEGPNC